MPESISPILIGLLGSGVIIGTGLLFLLVFTVRERTRLYWAYLFLSCLILIWTASDLALVFTRPDHLWFWVRLRFSAISFLGYAWLLLAIRYTSPGKWLNGRLRLLLIIPAIFTFLAVQTNGYHHLFLVSFSASNSYVFGPLFWLHSVISYIYIISGLLFYVWIALNHNTAYLRQSLLMIFACLPPLAVNVLNVLKLVALPVDPTPLALTITLLLFGFSAFRLSFLSAIPIAYSDVFNNMSSPILVLDQNNCIIGMNTLAYSLLPGILQMDGQIKLGDSVTRDFLDRVAPRIVNYAELRHKLLQLAGDPTGSLVCEVEIEGPGKKLFWEVTVRPVFNRSALGWVVILRDNTRLKELLNSLDNAERVIVSLARTIEAKDNYTEGHGERSAALAGAVAEKLGLSDQCRENLRMGMLLHDIGKIGIPDQILNKPGPLSPKEFDLVKRHPLLGEEICRPLQSLQEILPIVRSHHEKLDGSGYPDGLKGDMVPLEARIACVVDIFDALTSERVYRTRYALEKALDILRQGVAEGKLDGLVVEALVEVVENRAAGEFVS